MLLRCHLVSFRWNADSLKSSFNCQDSHEPKFSQKFMSVIMKMGTKNVALDEVQHLNQLYHLLEKDN